MLPLVKANYNAKAVACSFGIVEDNGNRQIGVMFEVVDHPDLSGETQMWFGFFSEKTEYRTIESLQHMGWLGDDLVELADLDAEACARLLPNVVTLVCEPNTYKDKTTLSVRWVNKLGGGVFAFKAKLEGADLKAFASQMRGKIRGAREAGSRPSQPATRPSTSSAGRPASQARHPNAPDDDLPF